MNQSLTGNQLGFAFLQEAERPVMAPDEDVAGFTSEHDALNYAIDAYARRHGYTFTQTHLAEQLGMTKQTLSKLRQNLIGIPRNGLLRIVEVTRSYAPLQWYFFRLGLVVYTKEADQARRDKYDRVERERDRIRDERDEARSQLASYKRASGQ